MRFSGKAVIVTGAGQGLGKACAAETNHQHQFFRGKGDTLHRIG
jgi:NADP-dependent 3-hydroxy acid dehydrogenase YdfG